MLNPTFFSLNGSLPTCLASIKNDITNDTSYDKYITPALFTNRSVYSYRDENPVMCVGHKFEDECFKYEVGS